MIEAVNSDPSRLGQTFRASLDEPVIVNGREVIPRGADVLTELVQDQQLRQDSRQDDTDARPFDDHDQWPSPMTSPACTDVKTESSSRGRRSGKVIGGTAALGAIIGAIAGGGKGAAIGAGSGAAGSVRALKC